MQSLADDAWVGAPELVLVPQKLVAMAEATMGRKRVVKRREVHPGHEDPEINHETFMIMQHYACYAMLERKIIFKSRISTLGPIVGR